MRLALSCALVLSTAAVACAGSVESVTGGPAEAAAIRVYLSERAQVARVPVGELTDLYVCIANAMADKTGARTQRELADVAFEAAATLKGSTRDERLRDSQAMCNLLRDLP
jgi:hypothetical protein